MSKFRDKLRNQNVVVVGGTSGSANLTLQPLLTMTGIGYGVSRALLDAGARITIISSSEDRVNTAIKPGQGAAVEGALNSSVLSLTKGLATDLALKRR